MKEIILNCLKKIEQHEGMPSEDIIAFYFGLFESNTGYMLYVIGSSEYDENDDDWACTDSPIELYRYMNVVYTGEKETSEQVLHRMHLLLDEMESSGKFDDTILKHAKVIAMGFDEGDIFRIR